MKRKRWIFLFLGGMVFTIACGLSNLTGSRSDATSEAQRTLISGTVSVWSTASAQELSTQLAQLSTELQFTPSGSRGEDWLARWLTHPACQPPCWENITPGVTSLDEAARIVYQLPGVEITRLPSMTGALEGEKGLDWYFDRTDYCFISTYNNETIVPSIAFRLGDERNLLLGEVIAVFGNPTAVVNRGCRDRSHCSYPIMYKDHGMELYTDFQAGKVVEIQADTVITQIYLSPASIGRDTLDATVEWSGYGEYDFRK